MKVKAQNHSFGTPGGGSVVQAIESAIGSPSSSSLGLRATGFQALRNFFARGTDLALKH